MKHRTEPILTFSSARDIEAYMTGEPPSSKGFWLKLSKLGAPVVPSLDKAAAVEAALCCGWIDGQLDKFDDHYYLVRMTPRRPGSRWSAKNRATVERLSQEGRLKPAGSAQVEAARRDGRWDAAYASQATAQAPQDLLEALASNQAASRFFETLDRANRYAVIYRVNDAKLPQTRSKRIAQYVEMLARGETIHAPRTGKKA